ncbi:MAG: DUF805 domain-containing protein [Acidimicrobiales bacterium]|nr:DUF805 domain-containing protein [Hyphomonadaceae bacterium]RZV44964.1 MAG: DUF805 domain-containing protein [Acidimicrobiales bacterium]
MLARIRHLFLSPRGRINRSPFAIGLLVWLLFYGLQAIWFSVSGTSQLNFFLALCLLFLNIHILFCLYGKRLHDFGRTTWPLIGMFALVLITAIFVMLNFGGLEYFETLYENPEIAENAEAMKKVHEDYKAKLAENLPQTRLIMATIPILFTLWVGLKPGHTETNTYGEVPASFKP